MDVKHKANADQILDEHGFMVALRYDIHVRANVFNHRVIVGGKECVADVSVLREDQERSYNRSSEFKELGYQEIRTYEEKPGLIFSPHTGERERKTIGYLKFMTRKLQTIIVFVNRLRMKIKIKSLGILVILEILISLTSSMKEIVLIIIE
ncbi:hypothetical protein H4Q26_001033 [Puccinia striiformis f. sp. tritici PST-130]|nr:hypothetical protein H4Q26_001033 [Puccinia striiformis f. sp. tritici PST-130]